MSGSTASRRLLPSPANLVLRLLLVGAVVLWASHAYARQLVQPLLPLFVHALNALSSDFTILGMNISHAGANDALLLKADFARVLLVDGQFVYPLARDARGSGWMEVHLTLGGVLQHAALFLIILLAWPARALELTIRIALALPLIAALLIVNVPMTFLAELWFPVHNDLDPRGFWPLLAWSRFLMGGGGLVLALLLGIAVIAGAARLATIRPRWSLVLPCLLLLLAATLSVPAVAAPVSATSRARLGASQPVWVIVELNGTAVEQAAQAQRVQRNLRRDDAALLNVLRDGYRTIKSQVEAAARDGDVLNVIDYSHFPLAAWRINSLRALDRLQSLPQVVAVHENAALHAVSVSDLAFISQPTVAQEGATGAGTTIAVIDGGLGSNYLSYPDFGVCTGVNTPASTCRVVVDQIFYPGASANIVHGTNVSAIALGVAPAARLAMFDVFNGASASAADVLSSMNTAISQQATWNIVAINMSLGDSSSHPTQCTTSVFRSAVTNARNAGILTVVAAGNSGSKSGLSEPACAPGVVSVGAVYDNSYGTIGWNTPANSGGTCADVSAPDKVTCFSQSASYLSLLAPGSFVDAPDATFQQSGTSQATPHVSGAIAVLRARYPLEPITQTLQRLQLSSVVDVDPANSLSTPRLNLFASAHQGTALTLSGTGPDAAVAGNVSTFTLTVQNTGPLLATSLSVQMPLPDGATLQSASPGCTVSAAIVHCTASSLAAGFQRTFTLNVQWSVSGPVYTVASVAADQINSAAAPLQQFAFGTPPTTDADAPLPLWAYAALGLILFCISQLHARQMATVARAKHCV